MVNKYNKSKIERYSYVFSTCIAYFTSGTLTIPFWQKLLLDPLHPGKQDIQTEEQSSQ